VSELGSCEKVQQDPTFNLIGRPRGPRMKCGWGCGAKLTGRNMRAHFTICPKRSAAFHRRGPTRGKQSSPNGSASAVRVALQTPRQRRRRLFSPDSSSPRTRLNRPISAYFSGGLSFRVSVRIFRMRLARRSRSRRADLSSTLRRYISRTCWAAINEAIRLDKSGRGGRPDEVV
jgi:hypothetical protein